MRLSSPSDLSTRTFFTFLKRFDPIPYTYNEASVFYLYRSNLQQKPFAHHEDPRLV